jgi:dTMP kinase
VSTGGGQARGALIVFEGGEGSGKSTQLRRVSATLARRHVSHLCLREPGGTPLGTEVRRVLLDRASDIAHRAEALLFMASRAQLVEREVRPALERGEVVLLDRFFLSTYAYQIVGRGLPEAEVRAANALATAGLVPDLTLLLDISATHGLERADARGARDRMEKASDDFHARVANAFREFTDPGWQASHPECGPIKLIDGTGDQAAVHKRIVSTLASAFPQPFGAIES